MRNGGKTEETSWRNPSIFIYLSLPAPWISYLEFCYIDRLLPVCIILGSVTDPWQFLFIISWESIFKKKTIIFFKYVRVIGLGKKRLNLLGGRLYLASPVRGPAQKCQVTQEAEAGRQVREPCPAWQCRRARPSRAPGLACQGDLRAGSTWSLLYWGSSVLLTWQVEVSMLLQEEQEWFVSK